MNKALLSSVTLIVSIWLTLGQVYGQQWTLQDKVDTEQYISSFRLEKYTTLGTDYFNDRYSYTRLGKRINQIDTTYDYPFSYLDKVSASLANVQRRKALKAIFDRVTSEAKNNLERHVAILTFLQKSSFHNPYMQPMHDDGMAVFDPIILLELGEMRCGAVARVGADLFEAAGYRVRIVQALAHVSAEVFYDGAWHLFEADLSGGRPMEINGHIPSVYELSQTPFLIDKTPTRFEGNVGPKNKSMKRKKSHIYPSYYFFSKDLKSIEAAYYYKIATEQQAAQSKWYGWNYYRTENNRWKLSVITPKYEPDAPRFKSIFFSGNKVTIDWHPSRDSDADLIGYRVYVSESSRGWNYQTFSGEEQVKPFFIGGWQPEMYESMFREPPRNFAFMQTRQTSITLDLPSGMQVFITVMPFDEHGESVGRTLYNMSEELCISVSLHSGL